MLPSVLMVSCCTCQTAVPTSEILKLDSCLAEIRIDVIEGICYGVQFQALKYRIHAFRKQQNILLTITKLLCFVSSSTWQNDYVIQFKSKKGNKNEYDTQFKSKKKTAIMWKKTSEITCIIASLNIF